MKFKLTNEEKEAIELYINGEYQVINQLLISDSNSDVSLIREDVENKSVKIDYSREVLVQDLNAMKVIYELLQKIKIERNKKDDWAFIRGSNIVEAERFKTEMFIDKFIDASADKEKAEKYYALSWNEPAVMYIRGESSIPYIDYEELENIDIPANKDILIAPFTKVKTITNSGELNFEDVSKKVRTYNIFLEKQELQGMPKEEKQNLYISILGNSDFINLKINEIVRLEKESNNIYDNIRKMEQLIAKYELELEKKKSQENYSDYEIQSEEENIERLKKEVNGLKTDVSQIYEKVKDCTEYVTNWKKNVTIYVMSEFYDIEMKYKDVKAKEDNILEEIEIKEIKEESEEKVKSEDEEKKNSKNSKKDKNKLKTEEQIPKADIEVKVSEKVENKKEIKEPEFSESDNIQLVSKMKDVVGGCKENEESINKLIEHIEYLLTRQQINAKIAGSVGAKYSALNNCFEMKKQVSILQELNSKIFEQAEHVYNFEKNLALEKLEEISKVNFQVSTLINYLNNPKSSVGRAKINRFEEMAIIEENEFKKNISDLLRNIRGEAELKKLRDDLEIIEDKNPLQRILGVFTGRNKLDEIMIEQIGIREDAIRRTLARNLRLDYNYSIHEIIAETEMFIKENEDDELIEQDVQSLKRIEEELKKVFVIIESKVKDIILEREGKNLPIDDRITREELLKIETYRFLKKYGYDKKDDNKPPIEYQDTTANEISRIVDYIKTSKII